MTIFSTISWYAPPKLVSHIIQFNLIVNSLLNHLFEELTRHNFSNFNKLGYVVWIWQK